MRIDLVSADVFVTPPPAYGGLEIVVANLATALTMIGHDVTLWAKAGSPPGPYRLETFEHVGDILDDRSKLGRLLESDVVHCHDWLGVGWELARRYPDRRFVATWHGPSIGPGTHWRRPPENLTVCGVSHTHAFNLSCELGVPVVGVPNGIHIEDYPAAEDSDGYLLSLNRLDPVKGHHRAIEVALHLDMRLVIAGPEWGVPDVDYVRGILRRCDGDQIRYEGSVGLERKVDLLRNAGALLWLGDFAEPFGLGMTEANACGTPVVALDRGAVREVLGHHPDPIDMPPYADGGYIAPRPQDIPSLTMEATLEHLRRYRLNAERYTDQIMAECYLEVYRRA